MTKGKILTQLTYLRVHDTSREEQVSRAREKLAGKSWQYGSGNRWSTSKNSIMIKRKYC